MKVLILEDEELAAERLQQQLQQLRPTIQVVARIDSVEEAVAFLEKQPQIDLGFFDIQLADGSSFQVFQQVLFSFPVIFTTAYDQYTLQAFKVNSIDYLLKPINDEELEAALQQYDQLHANFSSQKEALARVEQAIHQLQRDYKRRFVVKTGSHFLSIRIEHILHFFSENKITWLRHQNGKKYELDHTLEQLEQMLDPTLFFRVNRQSIVHIDSVLKATVYSSARLKLQLVDQTEVLVSRDRVATFRKWLDD
jgi:DNA-binding LytR/AlgR family response regulator